MGAYTKLRNSIDKKIQQLAENPEKIFKRIKLADVVIVIGGLMFLGFVLNLLSSIISFILLLATPT